MLSNRCQQQTFHIPSTASDTKHNTTALTFVDKLFYDGLHGPLRQSSVIIIQKKIHNIHNVQYYYKRETTYQAQIGNMCTVLHSTCSCWEWSSSTDVTNFVTFKQNEPIEKTARHRMVGCKATNRHMLEPLDFVHDVGELGCQCHILGLSANFPNN